VSPSELSTFVKAEALSLGFSLCGISGAVPAGRVQFNEWWVNQGFGAGMFFLRTQLPRRASLEQVLPGARSAIVCALRFPGGVQVRPSEPAGKVARYALQDDYHDRLLPMLTSLAARLDGAAGVEGSLAYVDTGPLNERALAAAAGIGWVGKNAMLIHPEEGSWFWLGEVITRAELAMDEPMADHCGKCRKCLDACPTGAIIEELRAVDSRKCLSYWNIEHRGPIPAEFHQPMGEWLLGCDICQEVCPWNAHSVRKGRPEVAAEYIPLDEILGLEKDEFKARFARRAISRAKLDGLKRNAKIVAENLIAPRGTTFSRL
jgi:epoxyqueuosine reductase